MRDSALLKQLMTQLKKAEGEKEALKLQQSNIGRELTAKENLIRDIQGRIEKLQAEELIVSEHAVLRYVERVMNINIEEIQEKILTDSIRSFYETLGNGEYPNNGFSVKIRDGIIVTILIPKANNAV